MARRTVRSAPRQTSASTLLLLLIAAAHPLSSAASGVSPSKPPAEAARLESVLYQLTQADDPAAFAQAHGISLVDGRVRVMIELRDGALLAEVDGITVEVSYQHLVRALVPINQLLPLSQQDEVTFVRLSYHPIAAEAGAMP